MSSFFIFAPGAWASIEVGAGTNSFTGGRFVPSLDLGYSNTDQAFAVSSTGVRNAYYYQSSYQVAYFKTWDAGMMWAGKMTSGFGGAAGYSIRSFQDQGSTTAKTVADFIAGPAIRMNLSYGFIYLNMSATFGIRNFSNHLTGLTFQDVESISLGARF